MKKNDDFPLELDSHEQALEDEFKHLDKAGLLVVNKLTTEESKMYQQAASNTLKLLREGKHWMVERRR